MKSIYKIVFVTDPYPVTKKDGTTCQKQTITLRELGGKYEDQFAATWLGSTPVVINEGATIAASLKFSIHTYEGQDYQDITLQEYVVLDPNFTTGHLPTIPTIKPMEFYLIRQPRQPWGIDGELCLNGAKVCDTVEHPDRYKRPGKYLITKDQNLFVHGDGAMACKKGQIVIGQRLMPGVVTQSLTIYNRLLDRLRKAWKRNEDVFIRID